MFLLYSFAQYLYPAIQTSTGGMRRPPTAPIDLRAACLLRHLGGEVTDEATLPGWPRSRDP